MELEKSLLKLNQLKAQAKQMHQLAISNELDTKPVNELFKKFDGKLTSVSKSVEKMRGFDSGEYEYVAPKVNPVMIRLIGDDDQKAEAKKGLKKEIKNQISEFKAKMEIFQKNWKEEKYKVVNHMNNEIHNLNNTNKGNVTKAIKDLEDLVGKF